MTVTPSAGGLYERAFAEMRRAAIAAEHVAADDPATAAPALALAALARERGAADDPEPREALAALLAELQRHDEMRAPADPGRGGAQAARRRDLRRQCPDAGSFPT